MRPKATVDMVQLRGGLAGEFDMRFGLAYCGHETRSNQMEIDAMIIEIEDHDANAEEANPTFCRDWGW